jgi:hypothetical protein
VRNFIDNCWDKVLSEVKDVKFYVVGFNPTQELLDLRSDNVIVIGLHEIKDLGLKI